MDEDHKKGGQRDWRQVGRLCIAAAASRALQPCVRLHVAACARKRRLQPPPACPPSAAASPVLPGPRADNFATPYLQVFCNALVPTCLALAAACYSGGGADLALGEAAPAAASAGGGGVAGLTRLLTGLHAAFLGYYACCCGDTWSSELGQLRWAVPERAGSQDWAALPPCLERTSRQPGPRLRQARQ